MQKPVLLITGASSGIGLATAIHFAEKGYRVYGFSRRVPKKQADLDLHHLSVDVCDESAVREAVRAVVEEAGRLDVVIANAGYGIAGAIEETQESDALRQYDVNYFGTLRLVQTVLPYLRAQKSGCLLCVSSLAAMVPIPFQSFYSGTKASLLSLMRCLAMETRGMGIRVSTLCPGDVSTGFTAARETNEVQGRLAEAELTEFGGVKEDAESRTFSPYAVRQKASLARMERDEQKGKPASSVATALWRLSQKKRPKSAYVLGWDYKAIALLTKLLPLRLMDYILAKLYA